MDKISGIITVKTCWECPNCGDYQYEDDVCTVGDFVSCQTCGEECEIEKLEDIR